MFAMAVVGAPSAGWAQIWAGPNDACASDALLGDLGGLRNRLAEDGIGFGLQNQTELWGNLTGGRRQGIEYDGLATASLCIDLDKAVQWKGATIFASSFQIYGPGPTRLRRTSGGRRMAQTGHEERSPSTSLNAGYGFRKKSIK